MTKHPSEKDVLPQHESESPDGKKSGLSRKSKKEETYREKRQKKLTRPRLRVFPIWLRVVVVLILIVAALVIGLMVGFSVIGDGSPTDVLRGDTWQHIIDIVKKVD